MKNKNNNKYFLKGGAVGTDIPHLSPMQTGEAAPKPLSDLGVTVGQVPFSTPEQIQCVIDKGIPADKAKIIALRANNDCDKALEIWQSGGKQHVLDSADSWWPNKYSMAFIGGSKRQYTKKGKLKKKKREKKKEEEAKREKEKKINYCSTIN